MNESLLFSLPGNAKITHSLAQKLELEIGHMVVRRFPDQETYVQVCTEVVNKTVILVCSLHKPNAKLLPLLFVAQTLKELGAKKLCLVSPYLPYMRQDKRFHHGEAVTSAIFAQLLSSHMDCLITIDPHLHRVQQLSQIYNMDQLITLHATQVISQWISRHVNQPVLIGPDEESRQWVAEIAKYHHLPFIVGKKKRLGDRDVIVSLPQLKNEEQTPVIVDDVISTGQSMLETLSQLKLQGFKNAICIGVHALFSQQTEKKLLAQGAKIITCNTITHKTNQIDVAGLIAQGISKIHSQKY